jgi:hypothetical protein
MTYRHSLANLPDDVHGCPSAREDGVPACAAKIGEGVFYDTPERDKPEPIVMNQDREFVAFNPVSSRKNFTPVPTIPDAAQDWRMISVALVQSMGQVKFKAWFAKVTLTGLSPTTATLQVEGRFLHDYMDRHFREIILQAVKSYRPSVTRLSLNFINPEGNLT